MQTRGLCCPRALGVSALSPLRRLLSSSVNADEVAKFGKLASEWRNPDGVFSGLHSMNMARVPIIRRVAADVQGASSNARLPLAGLSILDVGCGGGILSEVCCVLA